MYSKQNILSHKAAFLNSFTLWPHDDKNNAPLKKCLLPPSTQNLEYNRLKVRGAIRFQSADLERRRLSRITLTGPTKSQCSGK